MEMTPLTAEKIAELERLLAAATAGPWHVETGSGQLGTIEAADGTMVAQSQAVIGDRHHERREANTALIAEAINALPGRRLGCIQRQRTGSVRGNH
jgi:hypothetical protein